MSRDNKKIENTDLIDLFDKDTSTKEAPDPLLVEGSKQGDDAEKEFDYWYEHATAISELDELEKKNFISFRGMSLKDVEQEKRLLERDKKSHSAASEQGSKARKLINVLELAIKEIEYMTEQPIDVLEEINQCLVDKRQKSYSIEELNSRNRYCRGLPWHDDAINDKQLYKLWYETVKNNKLIEFVEYDEFESALLHGGSLNWTGTNAQFRLFTWMLPLNTHAPWKDSLRVFLLRGESVVERYKSGTPSIKTIRPMTKLMRKAFGIEILNKHVNPDFQKVLEEVGLQGIDFK